MRRLARLIFLIAATSVVLAGTVTGVTALGKSLVAHATSAAADPLLPIGTSTLEGSTVYAADGTTVLATLRGAEIRRPIKLAQVSKTLIKAVLDIEDARFYTHGGFDVPSTVRALASDSSTRGGLQGGSTITQQLVKQTYLSSERKVSRKIKEAVLAERMQQKYTKDQILEAYLNIIYLGNSAYGVQAAANEYFNVDVSQVTLPEAALMAGLIQNPSGYDPIAHSVAARTRRSEVVARMVHYGDITQAQADAANATALPTAVTQPVASTDTISDYYVREIKNELLLGDSSPLGGNYNERKQALFEGGFKIISNLDPQLEALAKQKTAADTPPNPNGFEEAMAVVDPATGKVRAMVGGSGQVDAQYDVVTQGTRQPGSGFKLFTLVAALEAGYSPYSSVDATAPCAVDFPGNHGFLPPNKPATNDEGPGSGGVVNLVTATALSLNCGFIRLGHEVGLPAIAAMAQKMGITTPLALVNPKTGQSSFVPSMILGAEGVHPIDMAAAYATVAAGGVYHRPTFIDHITDRSGSTIYTGEDPGHRVISAQVAAEATVALNAVVVYGTGRAAGIYNRPVAGKTGTTTSFTDAWFNGFVPQLETTVWMGSPINTKSLYIHNSGVYGGTYPAETWHDFMVAALLNVPVEQFAPPDRSLLPPARYITSPSLVRDDHTDHNYYGSPAPPPTAPTVRPPTAPGAGAPATPTAPATTPARPATPGSPPAVGLPAPGTGGGPVPESSGVRA